MCYLAVDLDGSGKIEFDEFLEIMLKIKRGKSTGAKNSAMFDFFQSILFFNHRNEHRPTWLIIRQKYVISFKCQSIPQKKAPVINDVLE